MLSHISQKNLLSSSLLILSLFLLSPETKAMEEGLRENHTEIRKGIPLTFRKGTAQEYTEKDGMITIITDNNNRATYQAITNRVNVAAGEMFQIPYEIKVEEGGKMSFGVLNTKGDNWIGGEAIFLEAGSYTGVKEILIPQGESLISLVLRNYHLGTAGQSTFTTKLGLEKVEVQKSIISIPEKTGNTIPLKFKKLYAQEYKEEKGIIEITTKNDNRASYQAETNRVKVTPGEKFQIPYKITVEEGGKMAFGVLNSARNGWIGGEVPFLEPKSYTGVKEIMIPQGESEISLVLLNYHLGTAGQSTFTAKLGLEKMEESKELSPLLLNNSHLQDLIEKNGPKIEEKINNFIEDNNFLNIKKGELDPKTEIYEKFLGIIGSNNDNDLKNIKKFTSHLSENELADIQIALSKYAEILPSDSKKPNNLLNIIEKALELKLSAEEIRLRRKAIENSKETFLSKFQNFEHAKVIALLLKGNEGQIQAIAENYDQLAQLAPQNSSNLFDLMDSALAVPIKELKTRLEAISKDKKKLLSKSQSFDHVKVIALLLKGNVDQIQAIADNYDQLTTFGFNVSLIESAITVPAGELKSRLEAINNNMDKVSVRIPLKKLNLNNDDDNKVNSIRPFSEKINNFSDRSYLRNESQIYYLECQEDLPRIVSSLLKGTVEQIIDIANNAQIFFVDCLADKIIYVYHTEESSYYEKKVSVWNIYRPVIIDEIISLKLDSQEIKERGEAILKQKEVFFHHIYYDHEITAYLMKCRVEQIEKIAEYIKELPVYFNIKKLQGFLVTPIVRHLITAYLQTNDEEMSRRIKIIKEKQQKLFQISWGASQRHINFLSDLFYHSESEIEKITKQSLLYNHEYKVVKSSY
jgi:hypothetical protein